MSLQNYRNLNLGYLFKTSIEENVLKSSTGEEIRVSVSMETDKTDQTNQAYDMIGTFFVSLANVMNSDDIKKEYDILHNELVKYNPELLGKRRVLAITKSDMLDQELMDALAEDLPDVPYVFISSITNSGLMDLKDLLWKELNKETFHEVERIVHKNLDVSALQFDDDDDYVFPEDEDEEPEEYDEYDWDEDDESTQN